MKIIYTKILLLIASKLYAQNFPAQFINLPLQHLSTTIICEDNATVRFCQYNSPNLFDRYINFYFSHLDCEQKTVRLFDSLAIEMDVFKKLGGVITDFAYVDSNLFLVGTKNIIVLNKSKIIQVERNNGFRSILNTQYGIYLANTYSNQIAGKSCVLQKLVFTDNDYSLSECISYKEFTLENPLSIHGSSINFVISNKKDIVYDVNFSENTIDKLELSEYVKKKYPFTQINIPPIDSASLRECMRVQRNYTRNPTEVNLFIMDSTLLSMPHITSIAALKKNTLVLNLSNMKAENSFSQLFIVQLDSGDVITKDISWKTNKDNIYIKNYVPYYSFGRRVYTACNQYIILLSTVDETKLSESFTLQEYQVVRNETQTVKSIVLVNLNE